MLPLREQIKTVFMAGLERLTNRLRVVAETKGWKVTVPKVARYVPNFKTGIHHFCIHAGGRAVIDGIEKNLQLSKEDTEPSRLALEHFGGFRQAEHQPEHQHGASSPPPPPSPMYSLSLEPLHSLQGCCCPHSQGPLCRGIAVHPDFCHRLVTLRPPDVLFAL